MPMYSNDYSEDEAAGEKEEHAASSRERLLASSPPASGPLSFNRYLSQQRQPTPNFYRFSAEESPRLATTTIDI